jgi:hypothetical protein
MPNTREKLIELLKTIPQVNQAQAYVDGIDYVFGCAADYLIANGVTVQEWISVKDRLPDEDGWYLTYRGEYGGICIVHYKVLKTKGKWMCKWEEVTHWMPLPQPPKGE